MKCWRQSLALALAAAFVFADFDLDRPGLSNAAIHFSTPAEARIGHPLTPLSYAGVARRTTRRVVRHTAYRLAVLPPGCVYGPYYGSYYYRCGGTYYAREGGVYIQVVIQ